MFVSSLFDKEKKKKKKGEFFKEALYLGTQIKKKGTEGRDLLGGDFEFDGCVVVFLSHGFSITIDEAEKKNHHHRLSVRKGGTPKSVSRDI